MMYAISGGVIIGIAASLLFILFGRILSTSQIIQGVLSLKFNSLMAKRLTVIAAIVFSSAIIKELYHEHTIGIWFFDNKNFFNHLNPSILIMSGMLTGIGSILAGGGVYTHAVCGLPRFSKRSILACILIVVSAVYAHMNKFSSAISKNTAGHLDIKLPSNI